MTTMTLAATMTNDDNKDDDNDGQGNNDKNFDDNTDKFENEIIDADNPQELRQGGNLSAWNEYSTEI